MWRINSCENLFDLTLFNSANETKSAEVKLILDNKKFWKMKRTIGYMMASMLGGVLAFAGMRVYDDSRLNKQLEIEKLRNSHQESINQFVSYGMNAEAMDFTVAAEKTVNAVVHVKTTYEINGGYYSFDPIRQFFFGDGMQPQAPRIGAGAGSGVLISADGYIVTNNHVIDGASKVEIVLNDNKTYVAEVVGQDPSSDLALLKIEGENFPTVQYGNSDQLKVGEWVIAVGNPFNLESTVTAGIVSAKGRDINILANSADGVNAVESFIQTDAAVNPGNSGGALVNARGELIGINAAIKSNTGSYTGYSFAIPVNIVTKVVEDLLQFGVVQRGYLGVSIRNLDEELMEGSNLTSLSGVYVAEVIERGAARDAGIKPGDIVVKIAENPIKNVTELQEQVSRFRPGDKILVAVLRNGETLDIPVILKNRFGEAEVAPKKELEMHEKLGAVLETASKEELIKRNATNGVIVKELGPGKLKSAGILNDFMIISVDQEAVKSKEHLYDLLKSKSGGVLIEGVYPNGKKAFYGFGL